MATWLPVLRSIRGKLLAQFAVVIVLITALGAVGYVEIMRVEEVSDVVGPTNEVHASLVEVAGTLHALEDELDAYVVIGAPQHRRMLEDDLARLQQQLADLALKADAPDLPSALAAELGPLVDVIEAVRVELLLVLNSAAGDEASDIERLAAVFEHMSQAQRLVREFSLESLKLVSSGLEGQHDSLHVLLNRFLALGLAVLLVIAFASLFVTRTMRRLGTVTEAAGAIAGGDLHRVLVVTGDDEIDRLSASFNSMTGQLNSLIEDLESRVRRRTEQLSAANEALTGEVRERKRAEGELQEYADRLEESNEALQDFAYIASHDLQEPLRKVRSFGSRLETNYADKLDERGLDYLQRMQNAAARMQGLIEALLDYSRVTSQGRPFEPVDLGEVVADVLGDLEHRLDEWGDQVTVGDLPTIEADPLQMRQLFQNIIGNALKYKKPEQPAVVAVSSQSLDGSSGPWQISVADNGIGFDDKHAERIFGLFQRLQGRDAYEGTGIGLAICRKIIDRHSGAITVSSSPGVGTTFVMTLPASQPESVGQT